MKIHRSYYKEYLFFFGTDEQATGEGALGQQVDDLLAANVAVGAMCGFFDEAYTLYFASEFALNNLDYTVEEFVALSQGSFMNVKSIHTRSTERRNQRWMNINDLIWICFDQIFLQDC